ncbi:MAG: FkbM family methyltransferase [Pseudomonadota bacterium]
MLEPGDLAFDVGAHVGNRARAMRRAGARVVAVEPQEPFTTFLRYTLPRDVDVLDVALGRERSQLQLSISSAHPTVSTFSEGFRAAAKTATGFEHVEWDRSQPVKVVPLDDIIEKYGAPKYIKIDVEGTEAAVLEGLSLSIPLISVEYLPAMSKLGLALVDQLAGMGYPQFNIVRGETARFQWSDWRNVEDTKAWLSQQGVSDVSGDLFARRFPNEQAKNRPAAWPRICPDRLSGRVSRGGCVWPRNP